MLQRWAGAAHQNPLPIFGPNGVETVVPGLNTAYGVNTYRKMTLIGIPVTPLLY
jgi:ribonuclease Z